jgi:hypothetical protein
MNMGMTKNKRLMKYFLKVQLIIGRKVVGKW